MVQQIAVFIENRKGRALEVCDVLAKNGVDLSVVTLADTKDFGILRFIARDNAVAVKVLKEAGFTVTVNELVGAEVGDKPGGLAGLLKILDEANLSVEYLYSFAHTANNKAVILLQIENKEEAVRVLKSRGIKIISV